MKYPTILLLLIITLLAACGQKGPLYLPGSAPPQDNATAGQDESAPATNNDATVQP